MRAARRHQHQVKIARRIRILDATTYLGYDGHRDSRILNAHINCGCFGRALERRRDRKRTRREWQTTL